MTVNTQDIVYMIPPIIMIIGYIPSFIDLIVYKKKIINYLSYSLWGVANAAMFYYSFVVLSDVFFQVVSSIHCLACVLAVGVNFLIKDTLVN